MVVLTSFSEVWTIRLVYQLVYPFWWRVARGEGPNINHLYGFYHYLSISRCTVTLCCVWCMHYADASSLFNVWSLIWIFDTDWLEQKSNQFQSSKVDSFVMCFLSSSWWQRADCQLVKCGSGLVPQIDPLVKLYNHGEGPYYWLKAPTSAFTFKTLLRHYAKQALTPQ